MRLTQPREPGEKALVRHASSFLAFFTDGGIKTF